MSFNQQQQQKHSFASQIDKMKKNEKRKENCEEQKMLFLKAQNWKPTYQRALVQKLLFTYLLFSCTGMHRAIQSNLLLK